MNNTPTKEGLEKLIAEITPCFKADAFLDRFRMLMIDVFSSTAAQNFSVTQIDYLNIKRFFDEAKIITALYESSVTKNFETRLSNLSGDHSHLTWISLGEDCFPRVFLTRWGFKPFAALGEKSHPFDLAVHPLDAVRKLLRNDFNGYLDPNSLTFLAEKQHVFNQNLGITFNHEHGPDYAQNGFSKFISIYDRRLNNFRDAIRNAFYCFFFLHIQSPSDEDFDQLSKIFASLTKFTKKPSVLFVLRTHPAERKLSASTQVLHEKGIVVCDIAYPFPDYVWHFPQHCFHRLGMKFEREVCDIINDYLDSHAELSSLPSVSDQSSP